MGNIWSFITTFFAGLGEWWSWMTTPLFDNFKPIDIVGVTGVTVILAFWLIKLFNPLS